MCLTFWRVRPCRLTVDGYFLLRWMAQFGECPLRGVVPRGYRLDHSTHPALRGYPPMVGRWLGPKGLTRVSSSPLTTVKKQIRSEKLTCHRAFSGCTGGHPTVSLSFTWLRSARYRIFGSSRPTVDRRKRSRTSNRNGSQTLAS